MTRLASAIRPVTGLKLADREVPSDISHPRANLRDLVLLDIAADVENSVDSLYLAILESDKCDRATGNARGANRMHHEDDVNKDELGRELAHPILSTLLDTAQGGRCQLWLS